jgi:hypothetical protein
MLRILWLAAALAVAPAGGSDAAPSTQGRK